MSSIDRYIAVNHTAVDEWVKRTLNSYARSYIKGEELGYAPIANICWDKRRSNKASECLNHLGYTTSLGHYQKEFCFEKLKEIGTKPEVIFNSESEYGAKIHTYEADSLKKALSGYTETEVAYIATHLNEYEVLETSVEDTRWGSHYTRHTTRVTRKDDAEKYVTAAYEKSLIAYLGKHTDKAVHMLTGTKPKALDSRRYQGGIRGVSVDRVHFLDTQYITPKKIHKYRLDALKGIAYFKQAIKELDEVSTALDTLGLHEDKDLEAFFCDRFKREAVLHVNTDSRELKQIVEKVLKGAV